MITLHSDFVFVNTHGKRLFCRETAEKFDLIRLGPSHIVTSVNTESDIEEKYKNVLMFLALLRITNRS